MSSGIYLHKELGVNPRVINVHCFICGKTKADSLALLGTSNYKAICPNCDSRIYGGVRLHDKCPKCGERRESSWTHEDIADGEQIEMNATCSECQSLMKQGVVLISVRDGEEGQNPFRTGGWCVVKDEVIYKMVNDKKLADEICKKRMTYIPDEAWDMMKIPRNVEINNLEEKPKKKPIH